MDKNNVPQTDVDLKALELAMGFDNAHVNVFRSKKRHRTILQMGFRHNILKDLDFQPGFSIVPEPDFFFKLRGGTVENAAFVDIEPDGVKKILFELDIATGKATLKTE